MMLDVECPKHLVLRLEMAVRTVVYPKYLFCMHTELMPISLSTTSLSVTSSWITLLMTELVHHINRQGACLQRMTVMSWNRSCKSSHVTNSANSLDIHGQLTPFYNPIRSAMQAYVKQDPV